MSEFKWYSATTDQCDAKILEFERRIAALEAAAKPPADMRWAEAHYPPVECRDYAEEQRPTDVGTVDWRGKYDDAAAELREKKALLEKALADYTAKHKQADAAELERDEWKARWQGMRNRADAAAEECATLRTQRDEWRQRAQDNQAAADTLEKIREGEQIELDGYITVEFNLWQRITDEAKANRTAAAIAAQDLHSQELERRLEERDATIRSQDDHRLDLQKRLAAYINSVEELAYLRRDAERWRWVNTKSRWCGFVCDSTQIGINVELWNLTGVDGRKGFLKEAVDAAIAAEAAKEEAKE